MLWRTLFEVDVKYTPIKPIGKGAYGVVCSARNAETGEKVAIKKIANAFENATDARRTLREIRLLRHLYHENIIAVKDIMRPPQRHSFSDVYLVYELMDTDLHQIIRSSQPLTDDHYQYFIYQVGARQLPHAGAPGTSALPALPSGSRLLPPLRRIESNFCQLLRGLKYVHTANVLHRDLKPSNLLLNASCDLKICDFGLARTGSEKGFMTEYVVTRWYRAPELLLSCEEYTAAIDLWSVGCIFAELLGRTPLFPGKDYIHQLKLIINSIGSPDEDDLHFIQVSVPPSPPPHRLCSPFSLRLHLSSSHVPPLSALVPSPAATGQSVVQSQKARSYIRTLPYQPPVPLSRRYTRANPQALDLIEKMLVFDPRKRITVQAALEHPYLAMLHDPAVEPAAPAPFDFDFEDEDLREDALRDKVWKEMLYYHPDGPEDQ
eukprot:SM001846S03856  [mRNA]  locus=s1846:360:1941:- [translate_table: standard]